MTKTAIRGFNRLSLTTLVAVYLLILAGGVVRSTGSGMGCPDWPRCFGNWIPPTSVEELPAGYKEKYSEFRHKKNQKFARYLSLIGLDATANQILEDESILIEADFNATKTWIEYVNRLIGVIVGFLIIGLAWRSFYLRKDNPRIFFVSIVTLILVIVQGWFGSIVVSTNLTSWTVTVHMFLALLILAMIIYLYRDSTALKIGLHSPALFWLALSCTFFLLIQVFLGTEVREAIDRLASSMAERGQWISQAGWDFIVHRSFSWAVLISHLLLVYKLSKTTFPKILRLSLIGLLLGTFLSGVAMAYFAIPPVLQPVHLVSATGVFGVLMLILFGFNNETIQVQA